VLNRIKSKLSIYITDIYSIFLLFIILKYT
jgi:hypothetical protein